MHSRIETEKTVVLACAKASCNHSLKASEHLLFITPGRRHERLNMQWLLCCERSSAYPDFVSVPSHGKTFMAISLFSSVVSS
jgi:hypothetical protein